MSYILDALRRAEAERQRGAVPGLHAQPGPGLATGAAGSPRAGVPRLAWGLLGLLGLALAGAAGWWLRPAPVPAPAPIRPPAAAVLAGSGLAMPGLPPAAKPAGPATTPPTAPPPAVLRALNAPPPAGPPTAAPPLPPLPPLPPKPPLPPLAPAAAAAARLPSLAELPDAQRREIGPLVVGGAMHAEQAALRIVILNGQVFHEGDRLGPELQVQQIRLKSVVFNHRGQRFELPF